MSRDIHKLKEGAQRRTVLIVDDDHQLAESLARILKNFFKECIIASDGEEAYTLFCERYEKNNPFSVVITDLELPKMGGLRLIRQIRLLDTNQPVLILSAHDESEYMAEAIGLNVAGYLLKPLAMPKLFDGLEKIFSSNSHEISSSQSDIDPITGWKSFQELANRIQTVETAPITLLRMRVNHLSNIFTFVGELFSNEYIAELSALMQNILLDAKGEFYRTSNDEFCLVFEGDQLTLGKNIASNMVTMVRYFHTSEKGIILNSSLSVGIAYGKEHVLLHSKLALESLTDRIRGGYTIYTSSDQDENFTLRKSRDILRMIFTALQEENIVPFFQPIQDVQTSELFAYESVVRIRKENELFGPETFWSLAIDMGQMGMITRSMIRHTFELFHSISPSKPIILSLTAYDLSDESLIPYINFWGKRHQIQPEKILLQIMDGMNILQNPIILSSVQSLQKNGFKIILNDFGIGECNFISLLSLCPDFVKFHPDLITKGWIDPQFSLIVSKMIEIIRIIDAKSIAPEVAKIEQLKWLSNLGINYAEGPITGTIFEVDHV